MPEYHTRDMYELNKDKGYYSLHVQAIKNEGLTHPDDIAVELAYRDYMYDRLYREKVDADKFLEDAFKQWRDETARYEEQFIKDPTESATLIRELQDEIQYLRICMMNIFKADMDQTQQKWTFMNAMFDRDYKGSGFPYPFTSKQINEQLEKNIAI